MAKKVSKKTTKKVRKKAEPAVPTKSTAPGGRPSALFNTRGIYCGDCLKELADLPNNCVELIYIDAIGPRVGDEQVLGR